MLGSKEKTLTNIFAAALAAGKKHALAEIASPSKGERESELNERRGWWVSNGPHLEEAIRIVYRESKAVWEVAVLLYTGLTWWDINWGQFKAMVRAEVKAWDNETGWDAPNMNESDEDAFYESLVGLVLDQERHG